MCEAWVPERAKWGERQRLRKHRPKGERERKIETGWREVGRRGKGEKRQRQRRETGNMRETKRHMERGRL